MSLTGAMTHLESERVAEALLRINAVSINPEHPFKYASGLLSPIYTDCRLLSSYPDERRMIIEQLAGFVTKEIGLENIDVIVGTAHSGISLATYLAQRFSLPMAYVRTVAKEHGTRRQVEGILKKGQKALLLSDIMSTERDIPMSVGAIKKVGAKITFCLAIFSNKLGIIESFLEQEKIDYQSLTDIITLLSVALREKRISSNERATVLEWMKNPNTWNTLRKTKIGKILSKSKQKVSGTLLEINAVVLNTATPYKFASGILSPVYTDNRLLMSYPERWKEVIDSFTTIIIDKVGIQNVDVICGTCTAGIPHAAYLAEKLGLPMIYVKSKKDEFGKFSIIEGKLERGNKVLIIEDLVSSGGSSISAAKIIREAGGIVETCLAILTYGMKDSKKNFKREEIELITLTDLQTLLAEAIKQKYMKQDEQKAILEWVENPSLWSEKWNLMAKKTPE